MLSLHNIKKEYGTGENTVKALNGVSLNFREHEFVSILGPSGCGKTTLLNIIGGLDQYTSGDLVINGVSTKEYGDAQWDTYRNHSIGFVFQSYNLIPHQSVLSNVELALTLSGVSPRERRARAVEALKQVGLADQIHKRPNQMSGGQMQRVAIARALVNNPDILLADEPTGALDTQTSVQIMEILRQVSKTKLVIMVTHNPDLAKQYSTRIIRVLDGKVVNDSNPFTSSSTQDKSVFASFNAKNREPVRSASAKKKQSGKKKKSMSFFTAISLSLNNLMTKKGRTFMTSFAGSIGIIGIALILSVSTGVNNYINSVQRDTLASYPIQLHAETLDMTSLVTSLMQATNPDGELPHELDRVYESAVIAEIMNSLNSAETNVNDLESFKKYLESTDKFDEYLSAVQYTYNFDWNVLTKDADGKVIESDVMGLFKAMTAGSNNDGGSNSTGSSAMYSSFNVWQELLPGKGDENISSIIKEEYDVIYGSWPTDYNEVVLVVDEKNEISDLSLYALGLRTQAEIMEGILAAQRGEQLDTSQLGSWSYEELCNMEFRLLTKAESFQKQADGTYTDLFNTDMGLEYLYNNKSIGINLKISGILRPSENATSTVLTGAIGYTSALTEHVIDKTDDNALLAMQLENIHTDVLTGLPFKDDTQAELSNEQKKEAVLAYIASLEPAEKAALYTLLKSVPTEEQLAAAVGQAMMQMTPEQVTELLISAFMVQMNTDRDTAAQYVAAMTAEDIQKYAGLVIAAQVTEQHKATVEAQFGAMTANQLCQMFDNELPTMSEEQFVSIFENHLPEQYSESSYEDNLKALGYVDKAKPDGINLYASTFEDKDRIAELISEYNDGVSEESKISYTDYVALLMSSVTTIVNAISYVLIAFVAISLVVSSIMIGIITYISVLERTKEIGILRAIGASKKDVRRVFNAETIIVGFVAGLIGILCTLFFNFIINIILFELTGIAALKAVLPVGAAIILVLISMSLTVVAGLFPSGFAAKRNPVEALRSE